MLISVIVPCYNEEESLPLFKEKFDAVASSAQDVTFEFLFVNDGSRDGTQAILDQLAASDPRMRTLTFSRNFGKEAALLAGLENATGDLVTVMDADLQDPPEVLLQMLDILRETGCDCVASRRVTRAGEPPVRSWFARLFYRLINRFSTVEVVDGARDFRLMTREMVEAILMLRETRRFSKGLFAWVGFDVRYIDYENVERVAGTTKWSFWSLLVYALEGIVSLSVTPLALPLPCALLCLLACVVLLIVGQGAAALLCGLATLVLLCLWVVGQYVARIYWEAKKRPLYITKKER